MVDDELDLLMAAQWVLDRHGKEAEAWIRRRIEALAADGDTAGAVAWTEALNRLNTLKADEQTQVQRTH